MPHFLTFSFYLVLADAIFVCRLRRRQLFLPRTALCVLVILLSMCWFDRFATDSVGSSISYLVVFALTVCAGRFSFHVTWTDSVFCMTAGYSAHHITSILRRGVKEWAALTGQASVGTVVSILVTLLFYLLIYRVFGRKIVPGQELVKQKRLLPVVVLAVIAEIFLFDIVVVRMVQYPDYDRVYIGVICATNIICGIAILVIQFHLILQQSLEGELLVVQQMLQKERQQYQISKETIDLINQKCHDMKHQIRQLGKTRLDSETLQEMENVIGVYESMLKTGNQALDIILAEKSLLCQKDKVEISCVANGEALSFMSGSDIYALFGNLLDNAIHAALDMEEEFRTIGLIVKANAGFVSISSYNYYTGQVLMDQGMPVTTNPDRDHHGFGTKSIAMIVAKYNGSLEFRVEDDVFYVNILLHPMVDRFKLLDKHISF